MIKEEDINMELLDYLKWRNDISLSVSHFNDIDNVILSYISYMNFDELFSDNEGIYDIVRNILWMK